MAKYPSLPLWTDAFMADTMHLSAAEVGAYILLLFTAWRRPGCDLPDDDKYLAKVARCDQRKWRHLRPIMAQFHTIKDGRWVQDRLQKERKYVDDQSNKQRANINARWSKIKGVDDTSVIPTAYQTDTPTPIPKEEEESKKSKRHIAASPRRAATRWPDDGVIDPAWIDHAWLARQRHQLPEIDLRLEAERFQNFWSSKSGAQATKLDWHKTWINWTLKAEAPRNVGNGKAPSAHDKFFAAGLAVIEKLASDQADDDAEGGGDGEAGGALPSP